MYDITGSVWDLGLVGLFQFVPALLFTLPAGHVADRYHRGRIFAGCLFLQSVVAITLVVATHGDFVTRELILGNLTCSISLLLSMSLAMTSCISALSG
jgi:MFS family permease